MTVVGGRQRVCEWCGEALPEGSPPDKITCNDAHRAKRHRWLRGIRRADGSREEPPNASPLLQGDSSWASLREPRANGANGGRRSSGLQLSYRKTLGVLVGELATFVEPERVEAALKKALPDRQRHRLERST